MQQLDTGCLMKGEITRLCWRHTVWLSAVPFVSRLPCPLGCPVTFRLYIGYAVSPLLLPWPWIWQAFCAQPCLSAPMCFFRGERCGFPIANILSFYQTKEYEAAVMFAVKWEVVRSSNDRSACFLLTHIDKRNDRSMRFDSINITWVRNKNMENTLFILLLVCKEIFSVFSEMKEWMSESEF